MTACLPDRPGAGESTLSPVIVEVPYGVVAERRPKQRVQLGQHCDQPAKRRERGRSKRMSSPQQQSTQRVLVKCGNLGKPSDEEAGCKVHVLPSSGYWNYIRHASSANVRVSASNT